jgi:polyisoprenoid-binding protein YceI
MGAWRRIARWKRWVLIGVAILLVAVVGGPFAYIHLIEGKAPAPLTLASPSSGSSSSSGLSSATAPDGTWKVATGSVVGYRVNEVLFGQSNVAVGRTGAITGSITVASTTITAGTITVDMTTVTSDQSRRDEQFNGRIMETATYPTATLVLSDPVTLGSIPAVGAERSVQVTGTLTLHGVTKTVTFSVAGRYQGSTFSVAGSIPITFSDWNIQSPSFGPVTTEDHGTLEFSLVFADA